MTSATTCRTGSQCAATDIAIIGAGFGGLGAAIRLKQEGIEDFVVLERSADVGGTWSANSYPGCQCDVPSNLYSFSFAPKADWSNSYPEQPQILEYMRDCARRFGVDQRIRLNCELLDATWSASDRRWTRHRARQAARPRSHRRARAAQRAHAAAHPPASRASAGGSFTLPRGTTSTNSAVSAWRSWRPGLPRCKSRPASGGCWSACTSFSELRRGCCGTSAARYPRGYSGRTGARRYSSGWRGSASTRSVSRWAQAWPTSRDC
jgi:hypothetical protein